MFLFGFLLRMWRFLNGELRGVLTAFKDPDFWCWGDDDTHCGEPFCDCVRHS